MFNPNCDNKTDEGKTAMLEATLMQRDQTTEHDLQKCPLHRATREDVWPVNFPDDQTLRLQAGAGEDDVRHSSPERP